MRHGSLESIHIAIGDNVFYGGVVECAEHVDMVQSAPTIALDERVIVGERLPRRVQGVFMT